MGLYLTKRQWSRWFVWRHDAWIPLRNVPIDKPMPGRQSLSGSHRGNLDMSGHGGFKWFQSVEQCSFKMLQVLFFADVNRVFRGTIPPWHHCAISWWQRQHRPLMTVSQWMTWQRNAEGRMDALAVDQLHLDFQQQVDLPTANPSFNWNECKISNSPARFLTFLTSVGWCHHIHQQSYEITREIPHRIQSPWALVDQ